eukprot:CAMPEP_0168573728 /NCGR_PEP_ID=MMETSP0413-20121227/18692_1 /TAXON_ID=136452 /ORGANISM="Filamoeba nolandi, Strain NC-AS-23-1" /LENGTH=412 /DNA_ID=CAMNT_0008607003 /DNA_START=1233 /DNA_END=2471 /DNA_ORIENTATION=+
MTPTISPSNSPSCTPSPSVSFSQSPASVSSASPALTSSTPSTPSTSPSHVPTNHSASNSSSLGIIVGATIGATVMCLVAAAGPGPSLELVSPHDTESASRHQNSDKDMWEIDFTTIKIEQQIGKGGFGVIYSAKWRNQLCVVKQLDQSNENSARDFLKEASNVKHLRPHPNICLVLGICSNPHYPLCLVMEYVPNGSLWTMLVSRSLTLETKTVIDFALDIASGMFHLHSEDIIHCDLACRNLLVAPKNSSKYLLKITDFGLSRVTEREAYKASETSVFPIRWSAPEVLTQKLVSKPMDVWSFAVTLWEMIEVKMPYFHLTNADVAKAVCEDHLKLTRPTAVPIPDELFNLMESCWNDNPQLRPTFEQICEDLAVIKRNYGADNLPVQTVARQGNPYGNQTTSNNNNQTDYN